MAWVLPAMAIAGGVMNVAGTMTQARATQQANLEAARVAGINADLTESQQRKQLATITGAQRAGYAGAGVELTGSPLAVIADSMANQELDIQIARLNAMTQVRQYQTEAQNVVRTGIYRSVGTLLSTGFDYYSQYGKTRIGQ